MSLWGNNRIGAGLVMAAFALSGALYARLPALLPTHWNIHGAIDGYTPKPWGPFVMPITMAAMLLVFAALPRISPRGYSIERFRAVFAILCAAILGLLFVIHGAVLLAGLGFPVPMERVSPIGIGVLFMVLGNYLGKVTKNFFVGIRTPWTLASDEVWLRTHRVGGMVFVAAGFLSVVSAFFVSGWVVLLVATGFAVVIPVVYSYLLYRKIEGFRKDEAPGDPDSSPGANHP